MKLLVPALVSGAVFLIACGGHVPPAAEKVVVASCTPDFAEITTAPRKITSGNWEFQVRIYAVGCAPDVSEISEEAKVWIQKKITQLVERQGVAFFQKFNQRTLLANLLPEIQARVGTRAISRLHIVVLQSAESW
jgi:hypothetical protein